MKANPTAINTTRKTLRDAAGNFSAGRRTKPPLFTTTPWSASQ